MGSNLKPEDVLFGQPKIIVDQNLAYN